MARNLLVRPQTRSRRPPVTAFAIRALDLLIVTVIFTILT